MFKFEANCSSTASQASLALNDVKLASSQVNLSRRPSFSKTPGLCFKVIFMVRSKNRKKMQDAAKQLIEEQETTTVGLPEDGGDEGSCADLCRTPNPEDVSCPAVDEALSLIGHPIFTNSLTCYDYDHQGQDYYLPAGSRRILNYMTINAMPHYPGADEFKMMEILARTDYCLELSNGQRKYGPPRSHVDFKYNGPALNSGIFVGRIPNEIFEDKLIPLFETVGKIYDLRLMMDPVSGYSRGFAFITYFNEEDAAAAVNSLNNYEICKNKYLKVKTSFTNARLFIGNIPKHVVKQEIFEQFEKLVAGLVDVIVYQDLLERNRNRGFCFLQFRNHRFASSAKRKLDTSQVRVWDLEILVDWAEPQDEPEDEKMARVKVLFVRNLSIGMSEENVQMLFETYGAVEHTKKIKDYAFVHFEQREAAIQAMEEMQGKELVEGSGQYLEISLAKPPSDKKRKEEILRNRERRLTNMMNTKALAFTQFNVNYSGPRLSLLPTPNLQPHPPRLDGPEGTPFPIVRASVPTPPSSPPPSGLATSSLQLAAAAAAAAVFSSNGVPHLHSQPSSSHPPALSVMTTSNPVPPYLVPVHNVGWLRGPFY